MYIKNKIFVKRVFIFLLCLFFPTICFGQDKSADNTSPGAFLNVDLGTRAIAMGGTFVAVADDGSVIFTNPAGINNIRDILVNFHINTNFNDDYSGSLSFIIPPKEDSFVGLGFGVLGYSATANVIAYDDNGKSLGKHIENISLAPYISVAIRRSLLESASDSFGFTLKGLYSSMGDNKAYGVGVDLGALINLIIVQLGVSIKDLFTVVQVEGRDYAEFVSPRALIGLTYKITNIGEKSPNVLVSIELDKSLLKEDLVVSLGGFFRIWEYSKKQDRDLSDSERELEDILSGLDDSIKFGSSEVNIARLYLLAGYDSFRFSTGLSFVFTPLKLRLDCSTQFPTAQNENFTLFTTLELNF